jgi:hypothetical protein
MIDVDSPLFQCYIDAKTFQQDANVYDDSLTVIEKINESFSQTLFQYNNRWYFFRVEELYTSYNNNLIGNVWNVGTPTGINKRYDIEVGIDKEVKPISPEMLRLIQKKTKFDEIDFYYEQFNEVLDNETFARATYINTVGSSKFYSIDEWTLETGTLMSPTPPTINNEARIQEIYLTSVTGGLLERFLYIKNLAAAGLGYSWLKSASVPVKSFSFVNISFDTKRLYDISDVAAFVVIESTSGYYSLKENGKWVYSTTLNFLLGGIFLESNTQVNTEEWNTLEVDADRVPEDGMLTVRLMSLSNPANPTSVAYFKNLKLSIINGFENENYVRKINGINSLYTKTGTIVNSSKNQIYLDDHFSALHKGAIFQSNGTTLTDANWHRLRFPSETFGFRRQNATARWEHNRVNRNKIDVNFYGTMWDDNSTLMPVGLINTIRFLDDDPNKVYWIANLREIDYANGTWSATLEEVYDEIRDTPISQTFEADFTIGTYASPSIMPLTLVTSGGFSIQTSNTARYDNATTLTTPVDCSIFGVVSAATYPTTLSFQLQKNGVAIRTINYPIYIANQAYTMNLSVTTQTIATNDTFRVVVSGASSITINGGDMKINSPSSSLPYDTYTDNYLYD